MTPPFNTAARKYVQQQVQDGLIPADLLALYDEMIDAHRLIVMRHIVANNGARPDPDVVFHQVRQMFGLPKHTGPRIGLHHGLEANRAQ